MTTPIARLGAAAGIAVGAVIALAGPPAWSQAAPSVTVEPNSGAPGATIKITMSNYKACAADSPNCILIDFIQGATTTRIGTADSKNATTFSGEVKVPPGALPGPADVRAHSTADDAKAGYTVVAAASTTTSSSTSSTSTSSTSTTVAATTTSSSSSTSTTTIAATTTTVKPKKTSSHSDVPRYIAVALVVLAAAATAGVDTYLRRLKR
jgi:cobalamin biosynthesis Mg chelatase CobN